MSARRTSAKLTKQCLSDRLIESELPARRQDHRGREAHESRSDPSRVRILVTSVNGSRARCAMRVSSGSGRPTRQSRRWVARTAGPNPRGREWSSGRSRKPRAAREREGSREDREEVRLPGSAQGRPPGWWREGGMRVVSEAEGVISCARRRRAGRRTPRSVTMRCIWRKFVTRPRHVEIPGSRRLTTATCVPRRARNARYSGGTRR